MVAVQRSNRAKVMRAPEPARANLRSSSKLLQRRILLIATLLALAVCFYLIGGFARLTNHWAASAIHQRDYEAARAWLQRSHELDKTNATAYFLSARVARHEGDLNAMARQLSLAAQLGYDRDRIDLERDLGQAQSGYLEGIEEPLNQRLINNDKDSAEICDAYANGLSKSSRFAAALNVLEAWRSDLPGDPLPRHRIGRIEEYLQNFDKAKASYRAAIALDEKFYPAMYSLGRLLLDENNAEESAAMFARCLAIPNPAAAKVGLAMALAKSGDSARAMQLLYEVVELDQTTIQQSYASVGEPVERFVAAAELGKLQANAGNFKEAVRLLDIALDENPRDLAARYSRGIALRGLKRDDEARADMQHVEKVKNELQKVNALRNQINRNPEDVESRVKLGQLLIEVESERSGLFWIRSALVHGSNNPIVHRALAEFYESHLSQAADYPELAQYHRAKARQLEAE